MSAWRWTMSKLWKFVGPEAGAIDIAEEEVSRLSSGDTYTFNFRGHGDSKSSDRW